MSEIEKLYENAGVETNKYRLCCTGCKHIAKLEIINGYPSKWVCDKYEEVTNCDKAEPDYPPFTAEKQIELLEFNYKYSRVPDIGYIIELKKYDCPHYDNYGAFDTFQEALCADINYHWEYFTEEEKEQVREILE